MATAAAASSARPRVMYPAVAEPGYLEGAALLPCAQGGPALCVDRCEHHIRNAWKVDPRVEMPQQPAGKDDEVEVAACRCAHGEVKDAFTVGATSPELVFLRNLQQGVPHWFPRTVQDLSLDAHAIGCANRIVLERKREPEERPGGLRRRRDHQLSAGVALRPRRTMSHL